MRSIYLAVTLLLGLVTIAGADPLSHLSGRVLDAKHGTPVESALVLVAGPAGVELQLETDARGRYAAPIAPGSYIVIFVYGTARSSGRVVVPPDRPAVLDGKVDATEGEVIVIRDRIRPPVPPRATNHKPFKAPPYSDRAVVEDAWTKAWLLLDLSATGKVTRIKWLKRPGYDLEPIAIAEVKKLAFAPARDSSGKAVRTWLIWSIEWPSAWWLDKFIGTRTGMPRVTGLGRRQDDYVPCKGSGPWHMGSLHKTYKDCSQPDLEAAAREPWFVP